MMKPEFAEFIRKLCTHFDAQEPIPARMDSTFDDVRHLPGAALPAIAQHIRQNPKHEFFPKNLTAAILTAYEAVKRGVVQPPETQPEPAPYTMPSPEEQAENQRKCQELRRGLATGVRPPWAGQPRKECGIPGPDSYRRMG